MPDPRHPFHREPDDSLPIGELASIPLQFSGGVMLTDPTGRITWANDGFLKLSGYRLTEILGKKPGDFLQGPGTDRRTVERIREHLSNCEPFEAELLNYSRDGRPYFVYLKVDPVRDAQGSLTHFIGFQTDATESRKQTVLMRSILNSANHAILTLDPGGRIESFNPGAATLFGYSETEARELGPVALFKNRELKERASILERHLKHEVLPGFDLLRTLLHSGLQKLFSEWQFVRKDGSFFPGELDISPLYDSDRIVTGYLAMIRDRSELHVAETKLQDFSTRIGKLARLLPGVIYQFELLPDGRTRFPYASDAIEAIYRVKPEDVRNDAAPVHEVIHPEDLPGISEAVYESAYTLQPWQQEYRVRFSDGTVRWLHGYANPEALSNGSILWHGFITDVTERKEYERRLKESEERLSLAMDATRDGVWDWNLDTNEVLWSSRCYEMLGYEPNAFPVDYDTWVELIHPDDRDRAIRRVRRALLNRARPLSQQFRMRHRKGTYRWIAGRGKVVERDADGRALRLVGTHLDITSRKRRDQALRKANYRLEETNKQLELSIWHANKLAREAEAANEAKSTFIANMSHEIRTPMTSILGYADLLSESVLSEGDRFSYLKRIKDAGNHLLLIINDILDMSRIESGYIQTESLQVSPEAIIQDVTNMLRERAARQGLGLRIVISPDTPQFVITDPGRLRQILLNLLGNAIKFTVEGEIIIEAGLADNEMIFLTVRDTGIGISADSMNNLFQPFMQADSSTTRRFGGSGLGLAISQRLSEILGGRIEAESEPGMGSVFTVYLPLRAPSFSAPVEPDAPDLFREEAAFTGGDTGNVANRTDPVPIEELDRMSGPDLGGMTVLLVEDDPDIQQIVELYLKRAGVEFRSLNNGQLAVDHLCSGVESYDCVLMDIQMPEKDGHTAMEELLLHGYRGAVVAVTAHALSGEVSSILQSGFKDHIPKPIDRKQLYQCLEKYRPGSQG